MSLAKCFVTGVGVERDEEMGLKTAMLALDSDHEMVQEAGACVRVSVTLWPVSFTSSVRAHTDTHESASACSHAHTHVCTHTRTAHPVTNT